MEWVTDRHHLYPLTRKHSQSACTMLPARTVTHGVLWKCCRKPDCLPFKGWSVWQPYITIRAAAARFSQGPKRGAKAEALPRGASRPAVTLGRRAAAWFTRSTTDCKALATSSDIATFHIPLKLLWHRTQRNASALTTLGFQNKSLAEREVSRPECAPCRPAVSICALWLQMHTALKHTGTETWVRIPLRLQARRKKLFEVIFRNKVSKTVFTRFF